MAMMTMLLLLLLFAICSATAATTTTTATTNSIIINEHGQQVVKKSGHHSLTGGIDESNPLTAAIVTDPKEFSEMVDLLQEKLGGQCLSCTDEFFAECSNLVKPGRGITNNEYTDRGKWMDGWESRRKRDTGHDHAILKLGLPGLIKGVDIDTNNFIGNYPYYASLDAATVVDGEDYKKAEWTQILPKIPLNATSQHLRRIDSRFRNTRFTHVRLHIYPDGGVARLRIYGDVTPDWTKYSESDIVDVAAVENGGVAIACSDQHFGVKSNLNSPGRGINMGDGWETKRRRGPGHDWVIIKLGATCSEITKIEVDTAHFKGNFPDTCTIEGNYLEDSHGAHIALGWQEILPKTKLKADTQHIFQTKQLTSAASNNKINHIRLNIFPDGGVSRLRVWCSRA